MFRKLAPAPEYTLEQLQQLAESMREPSGQTGGWNQPDAPPPDRDNPDIAAGYTYFGQFVDHDITFDATSRLQVHNDPDALVDFRTPRYDLDSLYGSGPVDEPFQYDQARPGRLLVGPNRNSERDVPRNEQGIALIGDPRNDENVLVGGLSIVMMLLHNKLADMVDGDATVPADARFDETRRRVRWHYQWVVVHDYLPRICGAELLDRLLEYGAGTGRPDFHLRFYKPRNDPYMPIEFAAAAFRFGHSQVRPSYDLNAAIGNRPLFAPGDAPGIGADLRGGQPLLQGWTVDWPRFLPIGGSTPQPSRVIDAQLTTPLFDLPGVPAEEPQSLALRNLLRGQVHELPSGQDVARAVGVAPLSAAELGIALEPTPLWFYILKESELMPSDPGRAGRQLGPTGARIVAEVLLGLIEADPAAYLNQRPGWRPELPGASGHDGSFGLPDLVGFAVG
jgi:hypothetical protein